MREWNRSDKLRRRLISLLLAAGFFVLTASSGLQAFGAIPNTLSLSAGSQAVINFALPGSASLAAESGAVTLNNSNGGVEISAGDESGSASLIFRLLGILPVKKVDVEVSSEKILIPGGNSVGIAVETGGLVVVGMSDIGSMESPARKAGLRSGDVITKVNDEKVRTAEDLASVLSSGKAASFTVIRENSEKTFEVSPITDERDGTVRIGAWVRTSTAGVGTLTYVDPDTAEFGALGHAISDVDTGITLPVDQGGLYTSEIVQINRGKSGTPGEIVGDFISEANQIGDIDKNTNFGIFGKNYSGEVNSLYPEGLPVGKRSEVHTGAAQILSTVDQEVRAFDCEIERLENSDVPMMRSIVLKITDPELIAETGGIVQGMSGSPIIQDGKIIGAVTHVFVSDPTQGYGVYIDWMLEAAENA